MLQRHVGGAEPSQPVDEAGVVGDEQQLLAHVQRHGAVAGHQGGGVEQRHRRIHGATGPGVAQCGKGAVLPGQGEDLGHARVALAGLDQVEECGDDHTRDVTRVPVLVDPLLNLYGHRSSSNPSHH